MGFWSSLLGKRSDGDGAVAGDATPVAEPAPESSPSAEPAPDPRQPWELVRDTLVEMGVNPDVNIDDENDEDSELEISFSYQGGNYVVAMSRRRVYATICFPVIGEWDVKWTPVIRSICNTLSGTSSLLVFVYRHLADSGKVAVDIHVNFAAIDHPHFATLLKNCLEACFVGSRQFFGAFDETTEKGARFDDGSDLEMIQMAYGRAEKLAVEIAAGKVVRPEVTGSRRPAAPLGALTPANILSTCFGVDLDTLAGTDADLNRDLADGMRQSGADSDTATLRLRRKAGMPEWLLMVSLLRHGAEDADASVEVIATLSQLDDVPGSRNIGTWSPRSRHFFVRLNPMSQARIDDAFKYMAREALAHMEANRPDLLTTEQRATLISSTEATRRKAFAGLMLFGEERFDEAAPLLAETYAALQGNYEWLDDDSRALLFITARYAGLSYLAAGQWHEAYFFLDVVFQTGRPEWILNYVDAMSRYDDFRLVMVIENVIQTVEARRERTDDDEAFLRQLNRRLALAYIKTRQLDEAETLLRPMLDTKSDGDFAIDSLARIERMRREDAERVADLDLPF